MTDSIPAFTKLVPGFDFLQGLVKNAGTALPGIGQWVAPTLDPEELAKRIEELRTVQFWLEQNARMLGATIQALEVQRMTLSTLKTMNVQMGDLRDSMKLNVPGAPAPAPAPAASAAAAPAGMVDPTEWWGALTKQFTQLAAGALQDKSGEAAQALAAGMVKQGFDAAAQSLKQVVGAPAKAPASVKKTQATKAAGAKRRAPRA